MVKPKMPSREKYEKANPTVAARMPLKSRDKLTAVLEKLRITLSELLIHFADETEIKLIPVEEAKKLGFEEAKKIYSVTYACNVCGEIIILSNPKIKEIVGNYLTQRGAGHQNCHNKSINK